MATTKRFEMKIMLSIVLVISCVANGGHEDGKDGTCNLYNRRGLTEAPAAGGADAAPAAGAPAAGASGDGVFDVSKCPNAKGDGVTDATQVRIHILKSVFVIDVVELIQTIHEFVLSECTKGVGRCLSFDFNSKSPNTKRRLVDSRA